MIMRIIMLLQWMMSLIKQAITRRMISSPPMWCLEQMPENVLTTINEHILIFLFL